MRAAQIFARKIGDNAWTGTRYVPVLGGDPRGPSAGEPAGGHEQMDVRMIPQGARPRMQDREAAEPCPHILRIACERQEGRGGALHQQPVHGLLMGSRERPQLIRQGERE